MYEKPVRLNNMLRETFQPYLESPQTLQGLLDSYNIPTQDWGSPLKGTKDVARLRAELLKGDSRLVLTPDKITRLTRPVRIIPSYRNAGVSWVCQEVKAKNGLNRDLTGFAERRRTNETMKQAIDRAMAEEVSSLVLSGLSLDGSQLLFQGMVPESRHARSYPKLPNFALIAIFSLFLQPDQGIPRDFELIETGDEPGITIYNWVKEQDYIN